MRNIENLWYVYSTTDSISRKQGASAYQSYREVIEPVCERFGFSLVQGCGVFSAISPNNDEEGCRSGLQTLMSAYRSNLSENQIGVRTYHPNRAKAWRILAGEEPLEVLGGPKTRSFFRALTGDDTAVVVDGHIFAVWIGQRITLDEAKMNEVTYRRIEGDIRSLAPIAHVSPSCFQAVTWFSWRHRHRISKGWVDRQNQGWFGF